VKKKKRTKKKRKAGYEVKGEKYRDKVTDGERESGQEADGKREKKDHQQHEIKRHRWAILPGWRGQDYRSDGKKEKFFGPDPTREVKRKRERTTQKEKRTVKGETGKPKNQI